MEPRDRGEVRWRPFGHFSPRQSREDISSLNEAWLHTLDEYVTDTPLSQVILPFMRACFFGGAVYAVLLLQKGHGAQVVADIASFLTKKPRVAIANAHTHSASTEPCRRKISREEPGASFKPRSNAGTDWETEET